MLNDALISFLADGLMILVVIAATILLLAKVKGPRFSAYCRILMAGLTAYVAAKLIGSIFQPEATRPFEQLGVEAGASFLNNPGFPSDHMLLAVALVYAVWFETKQAGWALILGASAFLIGLGRVLALVHTPLDVLGAVVIASLGIPWYLQRTANKQKKRNVRNRASTRVEPEL